MISFLIMVFLLSIELEVLWQVRSHGGVNENNSFQAGFYVASNPIAVNIYSVLDIVKTNRHEPRLRTNRHNTPHWNAATAGCPPPFSLYWNHNTTRTMMNIRIRFNMTKPSPILF
jgi:hypothetical protein